MAVEELGLEFIAKGFEGLNERLDAIDGKIDDVGKTSDKTGSIIQGGLSVALGNILAKAADVAVGAVGSLVGQLGDCISEAMESEKAIASLEQTIKSTGGAAGLTSDVAQDLAMKFRDLYGGSDEAVLAIEELGLTMGTISADEMPGFIQNVADLGAKMGSTEMAAKLMARAQEDPASTLMQLRRAGILFTEAQEEQIKEMQKAGDTAGAYNLVMKRVGEATEGAAAAMAGTAAGKMQIMQTRLSDIKETIGGALLPVLVSAGDMLLKAFDDPAVQAGIGMIADALKNAGAYIITLFSEAGPLLKSFGDEIVPVIVKAFGELSAWFDKNAPNIAKLMVKIGESVQLFAGFVMTTWGIVKPIFEAIVNIILDLASFILAVAVGDWATAFDAMGKVVSDAWEGIKGLFANLAEWVAGWFGMSWQGVIDMWRGNFEMMGQIAGLIWEKIKTAFSDAVVAVSGFMSGLWKDIAGTWDKITKAISDALGGTQNKIDTTSANIQSTWDTTWASINETVENILTAIDTFIHETISALFDWLGLNEDEMYRKWSNILEAMRMIAVEIWNRISEWITTTMGNIASTVSSKINEAKTAFETALGLMVTAASAKAGEIYTAITGKIAEIGTWITGMWETIKGWGSNIITAISEGISGAAYKIGDAITDAIKAVSLVAGPIWETLKGFGSDILEGIKTGITDSWAKISTALSTALSNVKANLTNAASTLYQALADIGGAMISAIINGIGENAGGLVDYVTKVIEDALKSWFAKLGLPWPFDEPEKQTAETAEGGDIMASLLAVTSQIYEQAVGTNTVLMGIYNAIQGRQIQGQPGGTSNVTNNYYNSSRTNNLTAQSLIRPGGLSLEFDTMSMVGR